MSIHRAVPTGRPPSWRPAGLRYYPLSHFFREKFGHRVWKVSVDAGLGCPNVDGTLGTGGCVFCNVASYSPSRRLQIKPVPEQFGEGVRRLRKRYGADRFVVYFQPATNTYAPADRLREVWTQAASLPEVVGLAVGTRPDSASDDVLDLLAELSRRTWVSVEYGLQTIHDRSLDWMNRGHRYEAFLDAVARSRERGLHLAAHVILGLPGESRDDMRATAEELARLRIDSVKLHNLYVVRDTPLATLYAAGEAAVPGREDYVRYVVDFLEALPPDCVVERLSGDAPPEYLIAPEWCLDKAAVRRAVEAELEHRDTWQGRRHDALPILEHNPCP